MKMTRIDPWGPRGSQANGPLCPGSWRGQCCRGQLGSRAHGPLEPISRVFYLEASVLFADGSAAAQSERTPSSGFISCVSRALNSVV